MGEDAGVVLGVGLALDLHHAALLGGGLGVDGVAGHHRAPLHQTRYTSGHTTHDTPDITLHITPDTLHDTWPHVTHCYPSDSATAAPRLS